MSKSWIALIVIAILSMLAMVGYDFYNSLSGNNIGFSKQVQQITPDLGQKQLQVLDTMDQKVLVKNADLDNK
jgi:predicted negative regulator of RcsB-dependent stress response